MNTTSGRCETRSGWRALAACGPMLGALCLALAAPSAAEGLRPPVAGSTTIVVLPDTQYYTQKYPHYFEAQTRWIAENATNRNIAYVLHVGDITQHGTTSEWAVARRCFDRVEGKVPYLLVAAAPHDYSGPGRTSLLSEFFPPAAFRRWPTFGGLMDADKLDNSYHLFRMGTQEWIAVGLEFGPSRRAIAWADGVLAKHRARRAILVTHAYLFYDNERFDYRRGRQRANPHGAFGDGADGQELWDALVRRHPNVMIVVCGHVATGGLGYRVDEGDYGNAVHQMMCCYQKMRGGGQAYLRLLEFMPDGATVRVQTYSPATRGINPWNPPLEDFTFALQSATRAEPKPVAPLPGAPPAAARANLRVPARLGNEAEGWRHWQSRTLQALPGAESLAAAPCGRYGGYRDARLKATGFFHTERDAQQRWWLVDPDGHPFLSVGVNAVRTAPTAKGRQAMEARFGSEGTWATNAAALLRGAGFNTLGSWSAPQPFAASSSAFVYTAQLNWMANYGLKRKGTRQESGHRGYTNDCIFVFDPEFEAYCRDAAAELTATREDPWLLGYFSDNELPFPDDALERFLALPKEEAGHAAAEQWLRQRRGAGASVTGTVSRAEGQAFLEHMADTYFRVVSGAIRAADPNHLYLGCRFYGPDLRKEALFRACARYADVVSVNWYRRWTPDRDRMDDWVRWTGKPFLVSEWCAMGMDSGLANETGAGWIVPTQADRGRFYENFALALLAHGGCVGWHWYRYLDNDPSDVVLDPVNVSGNKGIVNAAFEPYAPLVDAMRALNVRVFPLRDRLAAEPKGAGAQ